jgi:hypothetical protein
VGQNGTPFDVHFSAMPQDERSSKVLVMFEAKNGKTRAERVRGERVKAERVRVERVRAENDKTTAGGSKLRRPKAKRKPSR